MPGINTPGSAYPGQYAAGGTVAYTLTVDGGTCAVTGGDVTLTYTPFIPPMIGGWALGSMYPGQYYNQQNQAYTMTAAGATVAVTGGSVTFVVTPAPSPADVGVVGPLLPPRPHRVPQRYILHVGGGRIPVTGGWVDFRLWVGLATPIDLAWSALQADEDFEDEDEMLLALLGDI